MDSIAAEMCVIILLVSSVPPTVSCMVYFRHTYDYSLKRRGLPSTPIQSEGQNSRRF